MRRRPEEGDAALPPAQDALRQREPTHDVRNEILADLAPSTGAVDFVRQAACRPSEAASQLLLTRSAGPDQHQKFIPPLKLSILQWVDPRSSLPLPQRVPLCGPCWGAVKSRGARF